MVKWCWYELILLLLLHDFIAIAESFAISLKIYTYFVDWQKTSTVAKVTHECTISLWNLHMISTMSWFKQKKRIKERKRLLKKMVVLLFHLIVRWLSYHHKNAKQYNACMKCLNNKTYEYSQINEHINTWKLHKACIKFIHGTSKEVKALPNAIPYHFPLAASLPFIFFPLNVSLLLGILTKLRNS